MKIDHPSHGNVSTLKELWQEAFEDSAENIDLFFETAFDTEHSLCAFDGERAVAMLYWFDCEYMGERVAYMYAIATAKSHRGRGICRQLMSKAHEILKRSGYACVILVPGEKGLFEFYAKMGYSVFSTVDEKYVISVDSGISLEKINPREYGRIRNALLPENGVMQDGKCLDYLGAYAELYAGEGFLCACEINGDTARIHELLGNTEAADGIAYALGCKIGFVRAIGNGRAFSMYLPLGKCKIDTPAYFGLALD